MQLATRETLTEIKRNVQNCVGKKVMLQTNKGKRKSKTSEGILAEVYNSVFIVKVDSGLGGERKLSFSYSDILTETVEITLCETQENLKISQLCLQKYVRIKRTCKMRSNSPFTGSFYFSAMKKS